jgi:hypothetical protein
MRGIWALTGLVAFGLLGAVALAASPVDGTQWQIKLTTAAVRTASDDRVQFDKGRFTSPLFRPRGFVTSNYTLTEEKGAPVVWETMQTSEKEGTLSWRGELSGETMRGIASWRKRDGSVVNYTFTGRKVVGPAGAQVAEPAGPQVAEPTAPTAPKPPPAPKAKTKAKAPARSR